MSGLIQKKAIYIVISLVAGLCFLIFLPQKKDKTIFIDKKKEEISGNDKEHFDERKFSPLTVEFPGSYTNLHVRRYEISPGRTLVFSETYLKGEKFKVTKESYILPENTPLDIDVLINNNILISAPKQSKSCTISDGETTIKNLDMIKSPNRWGIIKYSGEKKYSDFYRLSIDTRNPPQEALYSSRITNLVHSSDGESSIKEIYDSISGLLYEKKVIKDNALVYSWELDKQTFIEKHKVEFPKDVFIPKPIKMKLGAVINSTNGFILIKKLMPGYPAEKAGLNNGDLVVRINDYICDDSTTVKKFIAILQDSNSVELEILRDGITHIFDMGEPPSIPATKLNTNFLPP